MSSAVTSLSLIPDSAETLMRAMHTDATQAWIENMQHYPHITFDILRRFGTGIAMLASWATDQQRNTNLQNGVEPLDTNKILNNIDRHIKDIVHNVNKAVDNTNTGNFGTTPTPLWESVCPADANNYKLKQRVLQHYIRNGDLKSIHDNPALVSKNFAKEDDHFDALISEPSTSWLEPTAGDKDAKLAGLKSEYAKALWRCQEKTWMPQAELDQAAYLVNLINHHLKGRYHWFRPISHIVRRKEDQLQYQDASSA
jgi:hypothetical protein